MSNELLPGTILYDHYKISECISTTEFSNIYIAEHLKENNKKVIIKELLHKAIGTNDRAKALEKFQEEIDIYKKLDHPNMAKIIDSFSSESAVYTENKQFIVMEYIEGKTLRKIKEEQKEDVSPDDAGKWLGQIIEVIKYLSEQNPPVIFYYLTPDHVMVTEEGEVKLINFGLGRFFRTGPFKSNQYMGIAGYAAPEQYGIKPVDNRADIFGAGAVIYYMLTQDDPEKHALNFSPVRTLNQMVSMQFARFISKCVQMKAEDRCENINEVIEKLNSITFGDTQVSPDKIKKK
ncbi:MAG: serine/threonine-protein kinase, partial [Candidatus Eremiobacterota bacterium]